MTPRFGTPGFALQRDRACRGVRDQRHHAPRDHSSTPPNATRTASTAVGPQCAGWVTDAAGRAVRRSRRRTARADASATNVLGRGACPVGGDDAAGSPTRSTKSVITSPGPASLRVLAWHPNSAARCLIQSQ